MAKISLSAAMTRFYFLFFFRLSLFVPFLSSPAHSRAPFSYGHVHPLPLVNFLSLGDLSSSLLFFLPFLLLLPPPCVYLRCQKFGHLTSLFASLTEDHKALSRRNNVFLCRLIATTCELLPHSTEGLFI
ncbi:hypothetical protein F5Y11DRAFT_270413 [Daldinia sp. FL1419]|nr:hypothetical protein F5Y11DRAFT_270413 [Daldinia sp. FL1419]